MRKLVGALSVLLVAGLIVAQPALAGTNNNSHHNTTDGGTIVSTTAEGGTAFNRVKNDVDVVTTNVNTNRASAVVTNEARGTSAASSDNAVNVNTTIGGDSDEYVDESVNTSIATSPQKTELQLGIPGLAAVTLSDPDRFTMYQLTVATTLALYEAGLIDKDEARVRAQRQLDRLEKQSTRPNGRTLLNGFGLVH